MRSASILTFLLLVLAPGEPLQAQPTPVNCTSRLNDVWSAGGAGAHASAANGESVGVWQSRGYYSGTSRGGIGQLLDSEGFASGPNFVVSLQELDPPFEPDVSMNDRREFVVVWSSAGPDGANRDIFARRYSRFGFPFGPEFRVNVYTTGEQSAPTVALADDGNFVVIWQSEGQDGDDSGIFGRRYDPAGAPLSDDFRIHTTVAAAQHSPEISMDNESGEFVVVWTSTDSGDSDILGQRFRADASRHGPEFLVNTTVTGEQHEPGIAMAPGGEFVVVWEGPDGDQSGIFGQRFGANGNPAGDEMSINLFTGDSQADPSVAIHPQGNFTVAWTSDQAHYRGQIFGNVIDMETGISQGGEQRLVFSSHTYGSEVSMHGTGGITLTYSSEGYANFRQGRFLAPPPCTDAVVPGPVNNLRVERRLGYQELTLSWDPAIGADYHVLFDESSADENFEDGWEVLEPGPACGNGICEPGAGEDCTACPMDCNGVQQGPRAGHFCCGDGSDGSNPVDCTDPLCGGVELCRPDVERIRVTVPLSYTSMRYYLVAGHNQCGRGPKRASGLP
jgi:hypothetical protein